jgi:hypothetical protein
MGAWGHGPFDNDAALDWVPEIATPEMWRRLRSTLEGGTNDEVRAAARFVRCIVTGCRAVAPTEFDITEIAIDALHRVLADRLWMASWDEPGTVRNDILTEIEMIQGTPLGTSMFDRPLP